MRCFVDTNLLVYAVDTRDADKHHQANAWMTRLWTFREGRLSVQVLNEYYVTVTRKLHPGMIPAQARADVIALRAWDPIPIDAHTVDVAWGLQDRASLSYWDALIVAAALRAECELLLSEDMQHGRRFGPLLVQSPFALDPATD